MQGGEIEKGTSPQKQNEEEIDPKDAEIRRLTKRIQELENILKGSRFRNHYDSHSNPSEAEDKFHLAFEFAADAILWADPETHTIINCNLAAEQMFERSKAELVGQPQNIIHPPETLDYHIKVFNNHCKSEGASVDEGQIVTKSGRVVDVEICATRSTIAGKEVLQGIFHDITARKEAEEALRESEGRYLAILRAAPVGIGVVRNRIFTWVGDMLLQMLGYEREEIIGQSARILYPNQEEYERVGREKYGDIERKGTGSIDTKWVRKDGKVLDILLSSTPIDVSDLSRGVTFTALDITERENIVSELRESEEKYRTLFESANDAIIIGTDNRFTGYNKQALTLYGLSFEEIKNKSPWELSPTIQPDGRYSEEKALEKLNLAISGIPQNFEWVHQRSDGSLINVEINLNRFELGGKPHIMAVIRDITDRIKNLRDLRDSELRYRTLFEAANDAIFLLHNGRFIDCNPKALEMFRCSREELLNFFPYQVSPPTQPDGKNSEEKAQEMDARALAGEPQFFEWVHSRQDGTLFSVEVNINAIELGGESYLLSIVRDITERKQIMKELEESEEKFRTVVEQSLMGILMVDSRGKIIFVNRAIEEISGYTISELLFTRLDEIGKFLPNFDPAAISINMDLLKKPGYTKQVKFVIKSKTGQLKNILVYARSIEFRQDTIILAIVQDITKQKLAEKKLRESEENYRNFLRNFRGIVYRTDTNLVPEFVFGRFEEITGYSQSDLQKGLVGWEKIIHPEDRMEADRSTKESLADPQSTLEREYRILRKDGQIRWVMETRQNILDANGEILAIEGFIYDITDHKRLEEQNFRTQKLESVALLAGGIAHDFNNILVGILGNVNLLQIEESISEEYELQLQDIEKAAIRARDLTKQLLTFSKGGAPSIHSESIVDIINDSVSFVMRGQKSTCTVIVEPNILPVSVDAGQINQVINNLLINAIQAMPNGGHIRIDIKSVFIAEDPEIPLPMGDYIHLSISDTGVGIPKKNFKNIFDPYFTTKKGGSGLGLATSYSIIKRHQGYMSFESTIDLGTTFHIYLPTTKEQPHSVEKSESICRFAGHALVIDDDPTIRRILSKMLTRLGFIVNVTPNGEEALLKFESALKHGKPFSLLITDLTIPGGLGGKEIIQEIRKLDANLIAIVSSGYTNDPTMMDFEKYGFQGILKKPFTISQLGKLLTKLMK